MSGVGPVVLEKNIDSVSVAADSVAYSKAFDLSCVDTFALEYKAACTGSPNVKLEVEQSTDGESGNWYTPENFAEIEPSLIDKNSHGVVISPIAVRWLRIKLTELTRTVTDTVVSLKLSVQAKFSA